jgi:hypothetical protein
MLCVAVLTHELATQLQLPASFPAYCSVALYPLVQCMST